MTPSDSPSSASAPPAESIRLLAYPLFFASGMAGLVYEIIWTRMLIYVFGSGLYAVSAVLAAFMAGLALGSALLGPRADRLRYPIRFYGILEFLIGTAGFLLPLALAELHRVDGWVYASQGQNFGALTAWRFAATFLLLLIPTTLMGATLPVLSKAMVRSRGSLGVHVGELYAINTAGAVAGAFLCGFHMIEHFGVRQTVMAAAALNFLAGIGAMLISAKLTREYTDVQEPHEVAPASAEPVAASPENLSGPLRGADIRLILFAAFVTGLVSIAAQVLWSRSLVFVFDFLKNTTYAFSAMLTIFLLGIAVGSALIGLILDRTPNPMRLYGTLLTVLGISIAASVGILRSGAHLLTLGNPFHEATQEFKWWMAVGNIMLQTFSVLGIPTLLMGMAFPVAAQAVATTKRLAGDLGSIYALNTAGAIFGSLFACFALVPWLGLGAGLYFLAAVDTLLGLVILWRAPSSRASFFAVAPAALLIYILLAWSGRGGAMQELALGEKLVHYEEGPMATVSVIKNSFGHNTIYVDGVGVAGTDPMLQTDQKSLAHFPMFLVEKPRKALTVGFGSGGASYSYLLHNQLEKVHCVEICREVLNAAPSLTAANHAFFDRKDARYRVILDDARPYLQYTQQKYDIIATDCTDLRYKSNANLYDLQYFRFCREKLEPGGVVVVWMPLGGLSVEMFKVALRTFHRVFPEMAVFYPDNEPTHYILLVGWNEKMSIDYRRFAERLAEPDVRSDLAELNLDDPIKLLSTFITAGPALDAYLAGDDINTEDRPRLEFESPKYGYQDQPVLDNLRTLMEVRTSIRPWIVEGSMPADALAKLERYEKAMPLIIEGHEFYRRVEIEPATRAYLAAQALTPEDASLKNLLEYHELAYKARQGNVWSLIMLGRANQLMGRREPALDLLNRGQATLAAQGGPKNDFEKGLLRNAETWRAELRKP